MRIERLALKGLLRFRDPIALDFTPLPPGLIAVVGENGAGKTTILDAMFAAFYGEFPSRAKTPLFDYVSGDRDAYLEADATFGAVTLRARTNLDGVARKRDAVILQVVEGQPARPITDGKGTTFDAYVATHLPAPEIVRASAFAAQNGHGAFTKLDRAGRRQLFASLIGLDQLEAFAATSREAAAIIDRAVATIDGELHALRPGTTDAEADAIGEEGNRLQVARDEGRIALDRAQRDLAAADAEVARLRVAAARVIALSEQHAAHVATLADQMARLERWQADVAAIGEDDRAARAAIEARRLATRDIAERERRAAIATDTTAVFTEKCASIERQRQDRRAPLEARLRNNRELVAHAADVRATAGQLDALEQEIAAREATLGDARSRLREADHLLHEARQAVFDEAGWPAALERARDSAQLLDRVPFGQQCADAGCAFVAQARTALLEIPACEAGVRRLEDARAVLADRQAAETAAADAVAELEREIADRKHTITTVHAKTRERLAALEASSARIAELERDLALIDAHADEDRARAELERDQAQVAIVETADRCTADLRRADETAAAELAALETRTTARRSAAEADGAALHQSIAELRAHVQRLAELRDAEAPASAALASAERAVVTAREAHGSAIGELARIEAEIAAFEAKRARFQRQQARRVALEDRLAALQRDLIEWQALAKVFGRDGLQVLEIANAGPTVATYANDLLESCFGTRFTLELVTQEVKAGGKGFKEAFEVKVYDAERGGEARDLADLSGGEMVIVDEALKGAIALFINARNEAPIRTCWRDETTGALDPENAIRYVQMLRRMRERGGFHHIIYISHNADAAALADVQLVVRDGTAVFVDPPFGATEAA